MASLEREQEDLLEALVEAHRMAPRDKRHKFFLLETMGGSSIIHPGVSGWTLSASRSDVEILARYSLVLLDYAGRSLSFFMTPEGLEHYDQRKGEGADRIEQVVAEIRGYLDGPAFASRFPAAFSNWASAERDMWSADSGAQLTAVGHRTREAMQAFATEALDAFKVDATDGDVTHVVARVRCLLETAQPRLGETEAAFLDALLAYWGTVSDLAQRQEHGAQRDGEPLAWEDARRLVFQAAIVMYEVDRAMTRSRVRSTGGA